MPDWAFHRHSGIRESMHVHCPSPCCITCCMFMSMSMSIDLYIEMPECRTVRHSVSPVPDWKKLMMLKPVGYWTKLMQSSIFLVWYQTKIRDAGMPMPALVSSMPMPSYYISPYQIFYRKYLCATFFEGLNFYKSLRMTSMYTVMPPVQK